MTTATKPGWRILTALAFVIVFLVGGCEASAPGQISNFVRDLLLNAVAAMAF